MIDIIVCGAGGRMGGLIIKLARSAGDFRLKGAVERKGHVLVGSEALPGIVVTSNLARVATGKEVVVDFTIPDATMEFLKVAAARKNPMVIGTTGFSPERTGVIKRASRRIPILMASNMSFGVNCFFEVVARASQLLPEYEVEILETHHRHKKDAPSGTAREIANIICRERGADPDKVLRYGRHGITGAREKKEIGIHSVRMGEVVGEHTVWFAAPGETIELSHRCYNRETFAAGALQAARFISGRKPGLYRMRDLVQARGSHVPGK